MNFFISIFSLDLCGLLVFVLASILSTAKGFDLELISTIPRHNFVGVNLPVTGAALDVAQTTINARFFPYLNLSVTLLYNKSDSMCDTPTVVGSDPNAPALLADYYNTQAANRCVAIIVSGCGGMTSIPYLAKEWNVLQFSNSMVPSFVYNHMTTPTSIGMAGSMDDAGTALLDLLLYFKWFHATFIMEFTSSTATTLYDLFYFTANALLRRYPKYRLLQLEKTQYNLQDEQSQKIALQLASARSRGK
ncbi:hypothetical protein BV898_12821 [Hypsibius exemplaris]|uniref:Receptor ligand binding region domain-containing protein n=1 Tax=Hypsibius exemplaris TaxID=2072580 RepID=A0A1W0WCH6_HYPEX|nr:hypothetical protein BV898_12821 [Hypsibius exemplaris]